MRDDDTKLSHLRFDACDLFVFIRPLIGLDNFVAPSGVMEPLAKIRRDNFRQNQESGKDFAQDYEQNANEPRFLLREKEIRFSVGLGWGWGLGTNIHPYSISRKNIDSNNYSSWTGNGKYPILFWMGSHLHKRWVTGFCDDPSGNYNNEQQPVQLVEKISFFLLISEG